VNHKLAIFILIIPALVFTLCSEGGVYEDEFPAASAETAGTSDITGTTENEPPPVIKLELLEISPGDLSPAFNPDLFVYNLNLTPEISGITITARPNIGCIASVDNVLLMPDYYSTVIIVNKPVSEIPLIVSAENFQVVTYSLRVTRMEERPVENRSFEVFNENSFPVKWTMAGAGECRSSGEYNYSGSYSGTFTTLTGTISGREVLSSPVEIDPDKKLIISAMFYTPSVESLSSERINISLKIYYYTDAECTIPSVTGTATMAKSAIKESAVWEKVKYERAPEDIPDDGHFARIGIRACYDSTGGGSKFDKIFFDNVSFQQ